MFQWLSEATDLEESLCFIVSACSFDADGWKYEDPELEIRSFDIVPLSDGYCFRICLTVTLVLKQRQIVEEALHEISPLKGERTCVGCNSCLTHSLFG